MSGDAFGSTNVFSDVHLLTQRQPRTMDDKVPQSFLLPEQFARWFASRGWSPRPHQLALLEQIGRNRQCLGGALRPSGGQLNAGIAEFKAQFKA